MRSDLQWIGPYSPLRTGIANYTADFFAALDGHWNIDVALEDGSELADYRSIRRIESKDLVPDVPTIIHLGNSEFHDLAFQRAVAAPGILVLHDVQLHHARAAAAVRHGRTREYWRELELEYGPPGVAAGRSLLAGLEPEDIDEYTMSERFVRAARLTLVHSEYAAAAIRRRTRGADVRVIPMGIPLPAVVSRSDARRALDIPDGVFLIASITHVNPYKRLPTVLRAMRRLLTKIPAARFIVAGTGSDSVSLRNEIEILGLQQAVRTCGYVDETTARLIASAADVCVNLRFPTAGETSASLLRLLGAGRPVLVSDAGASAELPEGVAIKIPVGHLEVESLTRFLIELEAQSGLREDLAIASRQFVAEEHSMARMIDAYREAVSDVYGKALTGIGGDPLEENPLAIRALEASRPASASSASAAAAIRSLGLDGSKAAIERAGVAVAELGLHQNTRAVAITPSNRLIRRIACRDCGEPIGPDGSCIFCGGEVLTRRAAVDLR